MSSSGSKNRPKSASIGNGAASKNGSATAAAGSPIAGRITLKMATTNAPTADNLVSKGCFLVLFILTRSRLQEDFVKVL